MHHTRALPMTAFPFHSCQGHCMDLRDQVRQLKRKRKLWSLRQKTNSTSWHVFEGMVKRYADMHILDEYRDSSFPHIFDWGKSIEFGCKKKKWHCFCFFRYREKCFQYSICRTKQAEFDLISIYIPALVHSLFYRILRCDVKAPKIWW